MARKAPSFTRRGAVLTPTPTVLVLCEDSKSSKDYLEDAKIKFRAQLSVRVLHPGITDPLGIIEAAIRKTRDFERVFCVIDQDEHASFDPALRLARKHEKVTVIPSYPCFEYWLLLHYVFSRKPYARSGNKSPADCLINDLKAIPEMSQYAKGSSKTLFDILSCRLDAAVENARKALTQANQDGNLNPSTRLHELIEFIKLLGSPIAANRTPLN